MLSPLKKFLAGAAVAVRVVFATLLHFRGPRDADQRARSAQLVIIPRQSRGLYDVSRS